MVGRSWRIAASGLLVAAVCVSFAGCSGSGGGQSGAAAAAASAAAKASRLSTEEKLRAALLTRVNGVAAAAPASIGDYGTLAAASAGSQGAVTPRACAAAARSGFEPAALRGAEAAAVTFKVAKNLVSEVLISSSGSSATAAMSGLVPAQCTHYVAEAGGKSVTYSVSQAAVTGIGRQAKALDVRPNGNGALEMWSLIYRGARFVGTVTVVGPNASEKAVQELGQQAYTFAVKTLS
jgi:trimeric autotransporter adhesin